VKRRAQLVAGAVALLVSTSGSLGQMPDAAPRTSAISGVVVDANSGQPLPNTVVTLTERESNRLLTDSKGRFLFRGLAAGDNYVLTAKKAGYFEGSYGSKNERGTRPIALGAGDWFSDARIELVRPGSISGTVRDEAGEPVVGAHVRVMTRFWIGGRQQLAVTQPVKTDDRGQYRATHLVAGRYIVSVLSPQQALPNDAAPQASAGPPLPEAVALDLDPWARLVVGNFVTPPPVVPGQPSTTYPTTYHPMTTLLSDAAAITLGPGEGRDGVDVQIRPVPAWRVSGRVDDPSAAGYLVRLLAPGTEELSLGSETATSYTDRNGRFTFLNVPDGRYTIEVRRGAMELRYAGNREISMLPIPMPGFAGARGGAGVISTAPAGVSYVYTSQPDERPRWGRQNVDVSAGDLSDVVVPLHQSVSLSGRFVWEKGGALVSSGNPVYGLVAEPAGSPSLGMPSAQLPPGTTTFTLPGLLPGEYWLKTVTGMPIKSIVWQGRDHTQIPFDTSAGQDITDLVVTFTDQTISLTGTVSNMPARPDGAAVLVFPAAREGWSHYGLRPFNFQSVPVSTAGKYSATLPAGDYYVVAVNHTLADAWHDPAFLGRAAPSASRVSVTWGEKKTLDLKMSEVR